MKINKHIEIVSSTKIGLSSMGKASRRAIKNVLAKHYTNVRITIVNDIVDLQNLVNHRPDLVFLGMKFIPMNPDLGPRDPDKIWVTDFLDEHDILYTGSGSGAHELELNKHLAKQCALEAGLTTSPFHVVSQNQPQIMDEMLLNFPLFIKPTNRGGGEGIDSYSVAHNFEAYNFKVRSIAFNHKSDSLIEEYLPGREFSVAILKDGDTSSYAAMPIELIAAADSNGKRFLGKETKSSNTERVLAVDDGLIRARVSALALEVFQAIDGRDYGRIDIRLDKDETPHFLEANLIPSLVSGYGSFPKACLINQDLDYEPMIIRIVRLAFDRNSDDALTGNPVSTQNEYALSIV